jgi:hypothetical protein
MAYKAIMRISSKAGVARYLVGRTIAAVELHPFETGRYRAQGTSFAPVITLDDGTELRFLVQETEGSEYGVEIIRSQRKPVPIIRHPKGRR